MFSACDRLACPLRLTGTMRRTSLREFTDAGLPFTCRLKFRGTLVLKILD